MNTNRDASQRTKINRAKTIDTYYQTMKNNINTGNAFLLPGRYSDTSASIHTEVVVGQKECCISNDVPTSNAVSPTYTTY